jgi:hypothetical protein
MTDKLPDESDDIPDMAHGFPGTPETFALTDELDANGSDLSLRASRAIRQLDGRLAELEETLKFVAENGRHFLLLTNSGEFADLSSRYQRLVARSRRMGELEVDDGCLVYRSGSLSVTVAAETATVYDVERDIPARRVKLSYESFFEDADEFFRPARLDSPHEPG